MTPAELEQTYELMAQKIDQVGPAQSEVYLAKLALLLAHTLADMPRVQTCIEQAAQSINLPKT